MRSVILFYDLCLLHAKFQIFASFFSCTAVGIFLTKLLLNYVRSSLKMISVSMRYVTLNFSVATIYSNHFVYEFGTTFVCMFVGYGAKLSAGSFYRAIVHCYVCNACRDQLSHVEYIT
jgi:hypothetical protein